MLHDFNENENHLAAQRGKAGWGGVGRLASEQAPVLAADTDITAPEYEYTPYEEVAAANTTAFDTAVPHPTGDTLPLPQFDFATGVSSCACPSTAAASAAAANAAAVVTPMPEAPKSINWLLILGAAGIGYFFLKGNPKPALGTLEPAPTVQDLGRPARKPKAKPQHVEHLSI